MCIRMCVAKCECPSDKPLWEANQCIARSSCPLPGAVEEPRAREAEPIHMMGGKMEPPMMGGMMGGWSAATDIGPASKVHRLAAFSFVKLQTHCAASNAIAAEKENKPLVERSVRDYNEKKETYKNDMIQKKLIIILLTGIKILQMIHFKKNYTTDK